MAKTKIEWALYNEDDSTESKNIYYENLDKDTYEQKYKDKLTCINGCKARIKFTARKNKNKFFSTWNKEGHLHNEDCQFGVDYQGKIGRKKLSEYYKSQNVDDEHIVNTIKNKVKNLEAQAKGITEVKPKASTLKVEKTGGASVPEFTEGETEGTTNGRVYIGSIEASLVTPAYLDMRKCIYGKINNVQFRSNESGEFYAYFNLENTKYNVSAYLPPAFYQTENNSLDKFERFIDVLEKNIGKVEFIFIGVGFIKNKKDNKGLSIEILNHIHFVINNTTYEKIITNSKIENVDYSV